LPYPVHQGTASRPPASRKGCPALRVPSGVMSESPLTKPLAGSCQHKWQNQKSPYIVAQVCEVCKLFRYKAGLTSDWEYRAPIPMGRVAPGEPGQA